MFGSISRKEYETGRQLYSMALSCAEKVFESLGIPKNEISEDGFSEILLNESVPFCEIILRRKNALSRGGYYIELSSLDGEGLPWLGEMIPKVRYIFQGEKNWEKAKIIVEKNEDRVEYTPYKNVNEFWQAIGDFVDNHESFLKMLVNL